MDSSSPSQAASVARAAGNAAALRRAAVVALSVIAVLALLLIGLVGLAGALRARAAPGRREHAGGYGAAAGPRREGALARRASWDIFRLNPCCTPWARFGDAPPGSYRAGASCEGFCSGYGDPLWGGASERENFSPDAPGACSGQSCAARKAVAAAQLERGALAVAAGRV